MVKTTNHTAPQPYLIDTRTNKEFFFPLWTERFQDSQELLRNTVLSDRIEVIDFDLGYETEDSQEPYMYFQFVDDSGEWKCRITDWENVQEILYFGYDDSLDFSFTAVSFEVMTGPEDSKVVTEPLSEWLERTREDLDWPGIRNLFRVALISGVGEYFSR